MLIKEQETIQEVPLARPAEGQKVWIDIAPGQGPTLSEVARALSWSAEVSALIDPDPDRAQLQTVGNTSVISLFVPEGQQIKHFSVVLAPSLLVTIRQDDIQILSDLKRELPDKVNLMDSAHFLLYEMLERTADRFLELMDDYEETFDALEEDVLDGIDRAHDVFALRHKLHHVRGVLAEMRRVAARLSRRQFATKTGLSDANIFVDVYDGFYHVMDNIDSLRDNLTSLVDLGLNQRSTRLNEIMKFLTIFSTIFLPLSFITGFFGMNLKSMPELSMPYGQELTILLMVVVAGSMLFVFWRRKWL